MYTTSRNIPRSCYRWFSVFTYLIGLNLFSVLWLVIASMIADGLSSSQPQPCLLFIQCTISPISPHLLSFKLPFLIIFLYNYELILNLQSYWCIWKQIRHHFTGSKYFVLLSEVDHSSELHILSPESHKAVIHALAIIEKYLTANYVRTRPWTIHNIGKLQHWLLAKFLKSWRGVKERRLLEPAAQWRAAI